MHKLYLNTVHSYIKFLTGYYFMDSEKVRSYFQKLLLLNWVSWMESRHSFWHTTIWHLHLGISLLHGWWGWQWLMRRRRCHNGDASPPTHVIDSESSPVGLHVRAYSLHDLTRSNICPPIERCLRTCHKKALLFLKVRKYQNIQNCHSVCCFALREIWSWSRSEMESQPMETLQIPFIASTRQ